MKEFKGLNGLGLHNYASYGGPSNNFVICNEETAKIFNDAFTNVIKKLNSTDFTRFDESCNNIIYGNKGFNEHNE